MTTLQLNQGKTSRAKLMAGGAAVGAAAGTALFLIARALPLGSSDQGAPAGDDMKTLAKRSIPFLTLLGFGIGSFVDTDIWVAVKIPPSVYGR